MLESIPMPDCTCETTSSWGCPMHAPKHMGLQFPNEEIRVKDNVLRDAALWREVAPLLNAAFVLDADCEMKQLARWLYDHKPELEAADAE